MKPERYDDVMPMNALREAGVTVSLATDNTPISLWYPVAQTVARKDFKTHRRSAKSRRCRAGGTALCHRERRVSDL